MEKGYNSDLLVDGVSVHVQTEDWGMENPYVVSRIYKGGAVVKSIKTAYSDIFEYGPTSAQMAIRLALRDQHQKILDQLISGQLTL